jgi:RecA/RadA recombinase
MTDVILEVKKLISEKKEKDIYKEVKEKKTSGFHVKPTDWREKYKHEAEGALIKTGTLIDELIGGGIPEGKSMMTYGIYGSGKSQVCFTAAVLCPNKVIFIDTEGTFRISRVKQICDARGLDFETVMDKIILIEPKDWIEQMFLLYDMPSPVDINGKVDLIICDSISKHFRGVEFVGRENLQVKNGFIREFILKMESIAQTHKAAFIYTTQIYDKPAAGPFSSPADIIQPVGGRSIQHQGDFVLFFRKGTGNVRIARMMDSSWNELGERSFLINDKGVDIIPKNAKVFSTEEDRSKTFAKKQQQGKIGSRKKKSVDIELDAEEQESDESEMSEDEEAINQILNE